MYFLCNRIMIAWLLAISVCVDLSADVDLNGSATSILESFSGDMDVAELNIVEITGAVSTVIERIRRDKLTIIELQELDKAFATMQNLVGNHLLRVELATNDNEAALEQMYRSQLWDDLNFGQVVFAYGRAWINLYITRQASGIKIKENALRIAQKGFRIASTQFFRPSLMYGAWAGIGYVEAELGRFGRAREIFKRLYDVMDETTNTSARKALELELRVLDVLTDNVKKENFNSFIDDDSAKILRMEAFSLLQQSREDGSHPIGARQRFKLLIRAGRMDQSLLDGMMAFPAMIASLGIGSWSELGAAEYRLRNRDYVRAVRKFNAFFKRGNAPRNLDLSHYRYRWAVAAYKAQFFQTSASVLEKLLRRKKLTKDMDKMASKLLYYAYSELESKKGSAINQKALRKAARAFVTKNPDDTAADAARLILARTSPNPNDALQLLEEVSGNPEYDNSVKQAVFEVRSRQFIRNLSQGKIEESRNLAEQGLKSFAEMDEKARNELVSLSVVVQMRAIIDPDVDKVLSAIKEIEQKRSESREVKRALIWSRLLLAKREDPEKLIRYLEELVAQGIPHWQMEFIYPFVSFLKSADLRVRAAERLVSSSKSEPSMDKRFRVIFIEGLLDLKNNEKAYKEAVLFTKDYPAYGDAWKLLGRGAEEEKKPFEADKAWAVVTKGTDPSQKVWWEGMISRLRIRSSTRPDQACSLLKKMIQSEKRLPNSKRRQYHRIKNRLECGFLTGAI